MVAPNGVAESQTQHENGFESSSKCCNKKQTGSNSGCSQSGRGMSAAGNIRFPRRLTNIFTYNGQ